jgi:hypothetical protein
VPCRSMQLMLLNDNDFGNTNAVSIHQVQNSCTGKIRCSSQQYRPSALFILEARCNDLISAESAVGQACQACASRTVSRYARP